jgi:hypothetical protein
MKVACLRIAVWTVLAVSAFAGYAAAADCPLYIPGGVIIRVLPDENLTAGTSSGPTVLTVTSDIRFFPNRPPLLARGSKILANIVESKQAGRLHGKAQLRIVLRSILTADFCEYPIDAKVIETVGRKVEDGVVWGNGHAKRDIVALLFPPTTVYQLLRLTSRGPQHVIDNETPVTIKLMEPVSLAPPPVRSTQNDRPAAPVLKPAPEAVPVAAKTCSLAETGQALTQPRTNKVMRPIRNLTPYHVSIALDNVPLATIPPCYGPWMIATPANEFRLEAAASLLTVGGQKQIPVKVVPSRNESGWDIVTDAPEPTAVTLTASSGQ